MTYDRLFSYFLPKILYILCVYMALANTIYVLYCSSTCNSGQDHVDNLEFK